MTLTCIVLHKKYWIWDKGNCCPKQNTELWFLSKRSYTVGLVFVHIYNASANLKLWRFGYYNYIINYLLCLPLCLTQMR